MTVAAEPVTRADRIRATLTRSFAPAVLLVEDDSARHAGHGGAHPDGQTHFNVLMVTTAFEGVSRVARSRAVYSALQNEFGEKEAGGLHALALTLRTPAEQEALR
jgi:stress-induced morphogen